MVDTNKIIERLKLFYFFAKPDKFEKIKEDTVSDAVTYYIFINVITILGFGIGMIIEAGTLVVFGFLIVVEFIRDAFFLVTYYILAKLLGGQGSFSDMVWVYAYGITPMKLYGWIPYLGVFGWLYVGTMINGIKEVFKLSTKRAAVVVIGSILLLIAIIAIIVFTVIGTLISA